MDPDNTISGAPTMELDGLDIGKEQNHVDPGEYPLKFISAKKGTSNSGNRKVEWRFSIAAGPNKGFPLTLHTILRDDLLWKVRQTAKALGGFNFDTGQIDGNALEAAKGSIVLGTVEDNEYMGETRSSLGRIAPHPEGPDFDPEEDYDDIPL